MPKPVELPAFRLAGGKRLAHSGAQASCWYPAKAEVGQAHRQDRFALPQLEGFATGWIGVHHGGFVTPLHHQHRLGHALQRGEWFAAEAREDGERLDADRRSFPAGLDRLCSRPSVPA